MDGTKATEVRYNWRQYQQGDHAGEDYETARVGTDHRGKTVSSITIGNAGNGPYAEILHEDGSRHVAFNINYIVYEG